MARVCTKKKFRLLLHEIPDNFFEAAPSEVGGKHYRRPRAGNQRADDLIIVAMFDVKECLYLIER